MRDKQQESDQRVENQSSRRSFLGVGAAVSLAAGAMPFSIQQAQAQSPDQQPGESLLDTWVRTKKARIGVDLTSAPLRFKDKDGKPTGMGIELLDLLMKDIGTTPEYTEMPFAQTFAALAAGKFDMIGTFVTILPSRSLRGTFAGFPAHYQQNIFYLKEGSKLSKLSDLNAPGKKLACQQGTSEEVTLKSLYPKAEIQTFPQMTDAISAVGTGRVDGLLTDVLFMQNMLKTYPNVVVFPQTVNAIPNTYFMAHNDFKLWAFITNWLRYQASLRTMHGLKDKWFGTESRDVYKIPGITVGSGGEPLEIPPV